MTTSEAEIQRPDMAEAAVERSGAGGGRPDPWGVKRAENLLTSLQGVLSARVVVSPIGEVTEIHILAQSGISPKQIVRNVESALLAHLGLKVDHRKISVAQTAEVRPIEALEGTAVRDQARRRGVVYRGLDVRPAGARRVELVVGLWVDGEDVTGSEEAADTPRARIQGASRAAVAAIDKVLPSFTFEFEGVKLIEAFDTELVVAGVHVLDGRVSTLLVGTAATRDSAEQAAVLAVLDATNRWVQSHRQ